MLEESLIDVSFDMFLYGLTINRFIRIKISEVSQLEEVVPHFIGVTYHAETTVPWIQL